MRIAQDILRMEERYEYGDIISLFGEATKTERRKALQVWQEVPRYPAQERRNPTNQFTSHNRPHSLSFSFFISFPQS